MSPEKKIYSVLSNEWTCWLCCLSIVCIRETDSVSLAVSVGNEIYSCTCFFWDSCLILISMLALLLLVFQIAGLMTQLGITLFIKVNMCATEIWDIYSFPEETAGSYLHEFNVHHPFYLDFSETYSKFTYGSNKKRHLLTSCRNAIQKIVQKIMT